MEKFGGGSRSIIEAEGGEIRGKSQSRRVKIGGEREKEEEIRVCREEGNGEKVTLRNGKDA